MAVLLSYAFLRAAQVGDADAQWLVDSAAEMLRAILQFTPFVSRVGRKSRARRAQSLVPFPVLAAASFAEPPSTFRTMGGRFESAVLERLAHIDVVFLPAVGPRHQALPAGEALSIKSLVQHCQQQFSLS